MQLRRKKNAEDNQERNCCWGPKNETKRESSTVSSAYSRKYGASLTYSRESLRKRFWIYTSQNASTTEIEIAKKIKKLNENDEIDCFIVQLPL
jgi:hypothetical protein